MSARLEGLRRRLDSKTPAHLVTGMTNIRYLLDAPALFDPSFRGLLLVCEDDAILVVDARYVAQAEAAELPCRVHELSGSPWETVARLEKKLGLKRISFEPAHMSVAEWGRLKQQTRSELVPAEGLVEEIRMCKEQSEIDLIAAAAKIADRAFTRIIETIKPGVSEAELATELDFMMRRDGADGPSFETIVASGANSAYPHAGATDKVFARGDLIKIDFGAIYRGYHSDMTRTLVLGKATQRQRDIYTHVAKAQELALQGLAVGVTGKEIDAVARDYFSSVGYGEQFGHNLGHGIGLEVHEKPALGRQSDVVLEEAMVFTVEPGLYFPGFGGVRIEDDVVLREHGIQVLTSATKELLEL